LFALRAALGAPFARFTAGDVDNHERSAPAWRIGRMRAHLGEQAAVNPAGHLLQAVRPGDQAGRLADGRA
jgi:hypothetical protein